MANLRPLTAQERAYQEIGLMFSKLAMDPKHRRTIYETLKKADPNTVWPDQIREDIRAELKAEAESKEIEREKQRQLSRMERQKADLKARYKDDDIKEIEGLMQKHGLHDYEVGAKLYAAEAPTVTGRNDAPTPSQRWDMPTDKELLANPAAWATKMAEQTIRELRSNVGSARR